jgi:hypothetical protein
MRKQKERKRNLPEPGKLQLQGIRLHKADCRLGELKPGELPGMAAQSLKYTIALHKDGKAVMVVADIGLQAKYSQHENPVISITATYIVNYVIEETFASNEKLQEFLRQVAVLNFWPYWREFVQSMTVRMGLPPFPVPLLYTGELKEMKVIKPKLPKRDN